MSEDEHQTSRPAALLLAALCFVILLAACGKKPGSVDPPEGVKDDMYPYTYPDPSTDPK